MFAPNSYKGINSCSLFTENLFFFVLICFALYNICMVLVYKDFHAYIGTHQHSQVLLSDPLYFTGRDYQFPFK